MHTLNVRVSPYLGECVGEVLLLLGEGTHAHHGVGGDHLVVVRVIDHKETYLVPHGLLASGQGDHGGDGSYIARFIGVNGFT